MGPPTIATIRRGSFHKPFSDDSQRNATVAARVLSRFFPPLCREVHGAILYEGFEPQDPVIMETGKGGGQKALTGARRAK
jgi:hypothetical protein